VEFNTADEAQEAYKAMKGQEIDGRQIFVDFAGERGSNNCYEYLTFKLKYTILSYLTFKLKYTILSEAEI